MTSETVETKKLHAEFSTDLGEASANSVPANNVEEEYEEEEEGLTMLDVLSYLFVFIILIVLIPASIVSTFEISNRVAFTVSVDNEIAQHKTELQALESSHSKADNNQKAKAALVSEIDLLEKFKQAAQVIIANGSIPLENDLFSFRDLLVLKAKSIEGNSSLSSVLQGKTAINKSKMLDGSPFILRIHEFNVFIDNINDLFVSFVCNYNSNSLLAISLILSCVIGALAGHFNRDDGYPFLLRSMISGVVMGFLVYLIAKGGAGLIDGQGKNHSFSLTLYGSCLASFLAGVFANRFFGLLRSLTSLFGGKSASKGFS
ncbi:MAG: hypothetical protein HQL80_01655 [Magnetococcales bacterium]|nr:hypothetical protein [Magnetococcales bacterium]